MAYTLIYDYGHEGSSVHQHKVYGPMDAAELYAFLAGAAFTTEECAALLDTGRVTVREPGFALEFWRLTEAPESA